MGERQGDATPDPAGQVGEARKRRGDIRAPLVISDPEMLTVSGAAAYISITEKTIRKAIKNGQLA